MNGSGWWQWVVRMHRWRPTTYRQAWSFAVLGLGVPGFVIRFVLSWLWPMEHSDWLAGALAYGASITVFGGLGQCYQLRRRRHRQAELEALYEAAIWRPYTKSQPPVP